MVTVILPNWYAAIIVLWFGAGAIELLLSAYITYLEWKLKKSRK